MRPNIDISHTLNGRVKDYAEQQDVTLEEAYREIIEAGLEAVEHPDQQ
jgi:predicted DNA-binding protein